MLFNIFILAISIFAIINCFENIKDYLKEFKSIKGKFSRHLGFLFNIFLMSYLVSTLKVPTHYDINQNTCKNVEQNKYIMKAVSEGIYTAHCLKKEDKTIIILGEAHYKGDEAKSLGKELMNVFPSYAIEGAKLEEMPIASRYFLKLVTGVVYPLIGLFFEESTIRDAAEIAQKENKPIYSLESGKLSLWDKEYSEMSFLRRDVVLTKRNLRMRDNLYEINKREKIVVAIVGMAHSEELAYMMNKKYDYQHGQIEL